MTGDFRSAVERFVSLTLYLKHFKFMNTQVLYPSVLTLFRYSHEDPDSDFIDCDLDALFKDLKTKTATPIDITQKLRIDRGPNKHNKSTITLSNSIYRRKYIRKCTDKENYSKLVLIV